MNKSSPHGGFITEGTVSHGTLRSQDLLRSFADEYERVLPFNSFSLCHDAREMADKLDTGAVSPEDDMFACELVGSLIDTLDGIAAREGMTFGAHEGDWSDFGYWRLEDISDDDAGIYEPREG